MIDNKKLKTIFELVKKDIDATNDNDETSLMMAAHEGDADLVREIIAAGADVNKRQEKNRDGSTGGGYTALILAATEGHLPVVQILLDAGAEAGLENHAGYDAAYYAEKNGHDEIAALLERIENDRLLTGIKLCLEGMKATPFT